MKLPLNRWTGLAVAAVVVVALALWWFLRPQPVSGITVHSAPLVRSLQFSGRVATLSRVDVGSTVTGRVATVRVEEGAQVRQADVLVQLETDELQAALQQADATAQQAKARMQGLHQSDRTALQAALAQADANLRNAQAGLLRTQQLVAQGFVSASQFDDAQRTLDVARAQARSAQAQVQANADAGTDAAQVQAQWVAAKAAADVARARLAQTQIRAPADARVLVRSVEPGQIVQAGRALLSLALAGPTQLVAQVDERFLDQLLVGQPASVLADAFPDQRFMAKVLSIAPSVDAQRGAVEVKFTLDQAAPAFLREDMTLSIEVETGRRAQALVLPLQALQNPSSDVAASVWLARNGRAQLQPVRLGLRTLDAVEVLEGLADGDVVLLGASIKPNARVRVQPQAWQPGASGGQNLAGAQSGAAALTHAMGR